MNKKQRNRVFVSVILIAITIVYFFMPNTSQFNSKDVYRTNQVNIKNSTFVNYDKSYNQEYPDELQNSVDLSKKVEVSGSYIQTTPQQSFIERSYIQHNNSNLHTTFINMMQNANSYNNKVYNGESDQFRNINAYSFGSESGRTKIITHNLHDNFDLQQHGFYSLHPYLSLPDHDNKRRSEIGGPGDQPDSNPIPVTDGVYYLLILAAVYAGWKMRLLKYLVLYFQ